MSVRYLLTDLGLVAVVTYRGRKLACTPRELGGTIAHLVALSKRHRVVA